MNTASLKKISGGLLLALVAILAGCIANDQITTWVIYPDGSARFMKIESNVHSTERGPKGAQELANYMTEFDAQKTGDHLRMTEAGGQLVESRWLSDIEPRANVMIVRFPAVAAVERAMSLQDENGRRIVTAKMIFDGLKRRLQWSIDLPASESTEPEPSPTAASVRAAQANGLSETRIVVSGGKIVAAQGFLVANDQQSAILEFSSVSEQVRAGQPFEIFLEWELTENP